MTQIGIMGAMSSEIEEYLKVMQQQEVIIIGKITFYKGIINSKKVVLTRSGIGKVNASIVSTILYTTFNCSIVIFTGVAGGVAPELDISDIVIARDTLQYDFDLKIFGYELGFIPENENQFIRCDEGLVDIASKVLEDVANRDNFNFKIGRIATADKFVSDKQQSLFLNTELNADAVEMEGAAVAQCAYKLGKKLLLIRSLSDKADGSAHNNFKEFEVMASKRAFNVVTAILEEIKINT